MCCYVLSLGAVLSLVLIHEYILKQNKIFCFIEKLTVSFLAHDDVVDWINIPSSFHLLFAFLDYFKITSVSQNVLHVCVFSKLGL